MLRPSLWFYLLLSFLAWLLEVSGDADFESVRTKMIKNASGREDPNVKYWRESGCPVCCVLITDKSTYTGESR